MTYIKTESKESLKLKEQAENDLRKNLIESKSFDIDTINQIIEMFNMVAVKYIFCRKNKTI